MNAKRDPDEYRKLKEQGEASPPADQEIIDRVDTRMAKRQAEHERSFIRRIFAR